MHQHLPGYGAEYELLPLFPTKGSPVLKATRSQTVEVRVRSVFQIPPGTYSLSILEGNITVLTS